MKTRIVTFILSAALFLPLQAKDEPPGTAVSLAGLAQKADAVVLAQVKDTDYFYRHDYPVSGSAYLKVLIPALREAGRMWHAGELRIAEEHVITTTTQRAMALLCERGRTSVCNDKTALLGCVAGNVHAIGICAISDFFEMAGWRVVNLGADVPIEEIARSVQLFDADVVMLSAALDPHLKAVQRAIADVRGLEERDVKIIVGGPAFEKVPDLWRKLGADGYSARVEDTEPLASRLTQS